MRTRRPRKRRTTKQQARRYAGRAVLVAACGVLLCVVLRVAALTACASGPAPAGSSLEAAKLRQRLCFPLATSAYRVSDPYGWREDPFTGREQFHRGIDLACAEGTAVCAALDGVVTVARRSASYGNYLRVCHAGGVETIYAHLQYLYVRAGEVVQAGQPLGTAGQTGRATGPHLHFELLCRGTRYAPGPALGLS